MRLYLSSFRLGNRPGQLLDLLAGGTRVAAITDADDYKSGADRVASFERERTDLASLGLEVRLLESLAVIAGTEDRQHAYVALTRGTDATAEDYCQRVTETRVGSN